MKRCTKCGKTQLLKEYWRSQRSKDGLHCYCKACSRKLSRERGLRQYHANPEKYRAVALRNYHKHREEYRARHKRYEQGVKDTVFNKYGGYECKCCGEKHKVFLTIDHVNGGGTSHRKSTGGGGRFTYYWIRRNNYPEGFQVLCFNCNSGRALNKGICPHNEN